MRHSLQAKRMGCKMAPQPPRRGKNNVRYKIGFGHSLPLIYIINEYF